MSALRPYQLTRLEHTPSQNIPLSHKILLFGMLKCLKLVLFKHDKGLTLKQNYLIKVVRKCKLEPTHIIQYTFINETSDTDNGIYKGLLYISEYSNLN